MASGTTTADGTEVEWSAAVAAWAKAAKPFLEGVAGTYGDLVTYRQLADALQENTGIATRSLLQNWIGEVLAAVSVADEAAGEPMLTSLVVTSDGSTGAGYGGAVERRYGSVPADLDRHAAEQRLECYRAFGAKLPANGGRPTLTPQAKVRRATRQRVTSQRTAGVCPTCHLQLPFTGVCQECSED